jgi:sigma-B regulation protein RsbU (phosphoserine phosphatase)
MLREVPEQAFPGLNVVPFYESAGDELTVGGDFYDAFPLEGGKVALVVGDVSGKGLDAAARTAEVKFVLRAYLREYPHPDTAVARLNAFLCEAQRLDERSGFVALCLAVADPAQGDVLCTIAAAEPPLVLRQNGTVEPLKPGGLPLAAMPNEHYQAVSIHLEPGDRLLMVTDGITEARRGEAFFGYEGLVRIVRQAASLPSLFQIGQTILDSARVFAGGRLTDDACLLIARRG